MSNKGTTLHTDKSVTQQNQPFQLINKNLISGVASYYSLELYGLNSSRAHIKFIKFINFQESLQLILLLFEVPVFGFTSHFLSLLSIKDKLS